MLSTSKNSRDVVKREIGDAWIYHNYLKDFALNKAILSPFRSEKKASFIVKVLPDGTLYHKDYADDKYKGDSITFVMQLFNLNYGSAVDKIKSDYDLGRKDYLKRPTVKPEDLKPKPLPVIKPILREHTEKDLRYWNQFSWKDGGLTAEDLKLEDIYSVESFTLDRKKMYQHPSELAFAYKFEKGWKIYFPERSDYKWFSSVPNTTIEGWENVKNFDRLIISKSRKDRLVLSRLFDNVINGQNESGSLLDSDVFKYFDNFSEVWVFFDSDAPGVKACTRLIEGRDWKYVNTPRELLVDKINDPAEWRKQKGYDPLRAYLESKGLRADK